MALLTKHIQSLTRDSVVFVIHLAVKPFALRTLLVRYKLTMGIPWKED